MLKAEITLLKNKQKGEEETNRKLTKVLKEHQTTLARNDKNDRAKRLLLSGVPETDISINGVRTEKDTEKIEQILNVMELENVRVTSQKRIAAKDQSA